MARWWRMKLLPPIPGLPSSVAQKVAAEAAPTKMPIFLRRGFRPELSAFDGPAAADEAASPNPGPSVFDGAKGRGGSRSYRNGFSIRGRPRTDAEMNFGLRRGLNPEPPPSMAQGSQMKMLP